MTGAAVAGAGMVTGFPALGAASVPTKAIPSSGERIPIMGMGTFVTFNVADGKALLKQRVQVLQTFFDEGGGMVDSSPMYGSSEEVIGYCLKRVTDQNPLFSATKIWTPSTGTGVRQMRQSEQRWGEPKFDLFQIHNLLNWEEHLNTLRAAKDEGRIRYLGITTSHGRRHGDLEELMKTEKGIDFVQLTYNPLDREVEDRLLPTARDRGIAIIVNRPFQRRGLFRHIGNEPLPGFAAEWGATSWAQLLLKFVVSHPAVTVAIPATRRVDHMRENMAAARGPMPTAGQRSQLIKLVNRL